jgi:hypothetical protein
MERKGLYSKLVLNQAHLDLEQHLCTETIPIPAEDEDLKVDGQYNDQDRLMDAVDSSQATLLSKKSRQKDKAEV